MALRLIQIPVGGYDKNLSYIVYDDKSREGIIIDPAGDYEQIEKAIKKTKMSVMGVVNTHGHSDHIEANDYFMTKYSAKAIGHVLAKQKVDMRVVNGDEIELGSEKIIVMHMPGHSKDSICLFFGSNLVCGDLVFASGPGRRDLAGGNEADFKRSLGKLFKLDDNIVIWPGHDYGGKKTSVGKIKKEMLRY